MTTFFLILFAFAFVYPVGYFTAAWIVLALVAAWHGWRWLWGAMAIAVIGIVTASYVLVDAPDADWPGLGLVVDSLIAWAILMFVVGAILTEWRSKQREKLEDSVGNFE